MNDETTGIAGAVNAAIIDIARDSGLSEVEAIEALNTCAADMSTTEKAQMLEALGGVHYESTKELADQITMINAGEKRGQGAKPQFIAKE